MQPRSRSNKKHGLPSDPHSDSSAADEHEESSSDATARSSNDEHEDSEPDSDALIAAENKRKKGRHNVLSSSDILSRTPITEPPADHESKKDCIQLYQYKTDGLDCVLFLPPGKSKRPKIFRASRRTFSK